MSAMSAKGLTSMNPPLNTGFSKRQLWHSGDWTYHPTVKSLVKNCSWEIYGTIEFHTECGMTFLRLFMFSRSHSLNDEKQNKSTFQHRYRGDYTRARACNHCPYHWEVPHSQLMTWKQIMQCSFWIYVVYGVPTFHLTVSTTTPPLHFTISSKCG